MPWALSAQLQNAIVDSWFLHLMRIFGSSTRSTQEFCERLMKNKSSWLRHTKSRQTGVITSIIASVAAAASAANFHCSTVLFMMKLLNSCKWLKCLAVLFLIGALIVDAKEENARGVLDTLKETYDDLPDAGKFATGAVAGFGATRFTVNKVVTFVKISGAVFIGCVSAFVVY